MIQNQIYRENQKLKLSKYSFPYACKLQNIKFDLKKLREALQLFQSDFTDIYEANQGLCDNHKELASSVKDHFFQVSLTKCVPSEKPISDCNTSSSSEKKETRSTKYRESISRRTDKPYLDEHNWNIPTPLFKKSYFYECVSTFKSPAIRVRLTTLQAKKSITPHIDYDINYACRIVVPIYTNEECWNYFWVRGEKHKVNIPSDGHPWFLNVGFKHAVENLGNQNRTVLMFSLAGTEDIQSLYKK